jgi:hypothetical protein
MVFAVILPRDCQFSTSSADQSICGRLTPPSWSATAARARNVAQPGIDLRHAPNQSVELLHQQRQGQQQRE